MNRAQRRAASRSARAGWRTWDDLDLLDDLVFVRVGGDDDCPTCRALGIDLDGDL